MKKVNLIIKFHEKTKQMVFDFEGFESRVYESNPLSFKLLEEEKYFNPYMIYEIKLKQFPECKSPIISFIDKVEFDNIVEDLVAFSTDKRKMITINYGK